MGNKASKNKVVAPANVEAIKNAILTKKACRFPDSGTLDARIYQEQLISRAIDLLDDNVQKIRRTTDFINLQEDIMKYRDERNIDDPTITVPGGKVTYKRHDWSLLTDDPVFIQADRQNPFQLFARPIADTQPVEAVRATFLDFRDRFVQARITVMSELRKGCV